LVGTKGAKKKNDLAPVRHWTGRINTTKARVYDVVEGRKSFILKQRKKKVCSAHTLKHGGKEKGGVSKEGELGGAETCAGVKVGEPKRQNWGLA